MSLWVDTGDIPGTQGDYLFRCSRGECLLMELEELTIKVLSLGASVIVSTQRQALCQRRAVGSLGNIGPGLSHRNLFHFLSWVKKPQSATMAPTSTSPMTTYPLPYFPADPY
jgi:hypothetical protein